MRAYLYICSLLCAVMLFASCTKTVQVPQQDINPISGTWYISDASANDGYGWYSFDHKLPGLFTFYNDGAALYEESYVIMHGYWEMNTLSSGYYDASGQYYQGLHNDFHVELSSSENGYLNMYFNNISFAGNNRFVATYDNGKFVERYTYTRY